jgi:predicted GTPase
MAPRNVVFFGQSGHGKSSVINLILGEDRAPTARAAAGCTAECTGYPHRLDGQEFILWDTCGLNEGQHGTITDFKAVGSLYKLLKTFEDGVSLLVFCFNGGRVNEVAQRNWELFRNIICQKQVPTVMAITNLEDEEDMDGWWTENEAMFLAHGIKPSSDFGSGVACITASRGKKLGDGRYRFQDEYETSQTKIRRLIVQNSRFSPWKVPSVTWFKQIITTSVQTEWCKKPREIEEEHQVSGRGIWELVIRWNMTEEEAAKMAKELESE